MRVAVVDTYYLPFLPRSTARSQTERAGYHHQLQALMSRQMGTADAYSVLPSRAWA